MIKKKKNKYCLKLSCDKPPTQQLKPGVFCKTPTLSDTNQMPANNMSSKFVSSKNKLSSVILVWPIKTGSDGEISRTL
ncbi:hypothetical protein [Candidatus Bathycorpusculum sp.]|jgi:hypothetical protein|uniref:hypothetical protein n=1 Tax=Candidatus Bathycorpusculum sp. TaxID=2994959 RepID=UPI0028196607|nr:hypothetical protein [Candidatus Termitimicrobium sp.]